MGEIGKGGNRGEGVHVGWVTVLILKQTHEQPASRENIAQCLTESIDYERFCPKGEDYAGEVRWRVEKA